MGIIAREVWTVYHEQCTGARQTLPAPLQYIDFVLWEQRMLREEAWYFEQQKAYWRSHLREGELPLLELPAIAPRHAASVDGFAGLPYTLPAHAASRLETTGRLHACSPFHVMHVLWSLLLCRHSGQDEVVMSTPYHGRDDLAMQDVVGPFSPMVTMLMDVPRTSVRSTMLRNMRRTWAESIYFMRVAVDIAKLLPKITGGEYRALFAWQQLSGDADGTGIDGAAQERANQEQSQSLEKRGMDAREVAGRGVETHTKKEMQEAGGGAGYDIGWICSPTSTGGVDGLSLIHI